MADLGRLHVLTPPAPSADVLARLADVLDVGVPVVQVRLKTGTDRERFRFASAVAALCADRGATCIVNDRPDIAVAVGAAGVHVGADDLPVAIARGLLGPAGLVGATCRDPESALDAARAGATYVGAGPCYQTSSKQGLPDPIGPAGIRRIASRVGLPVIAIAGVCAARVPELLAAGAHGVAVLGAVFDAYDPAAAVDEILAHLAR